MSEQNAGIPPGTDDEHGFAQAVAMFSAPDEEPGLGDLRGPELSRGQGPDEGATTDPDARHADDAAPVPDPASEDEPVFTVKIDGREEQVKLSDLRASYGKAKAADRRFEEAAQARKAVEAERQIIEQAKAEKALYANYIARLAAKLDGEKVPFPPDDLLDPHSDRYDPALHARQMARALQYREQLQSARAEHARLEAEHRAQAEQERGAHAARQFELMVSKVKEWKDPKVLERDIGKIRSSLASDYGLTPDEIAWLGTADHRLVLLARDAMRFREISSQKHIADAKVKDVPPVTRPGSLQPAAKDAKLQDAKSRLAKTGRLDDAAALFKALGV